MKVLRRILSYTGKYKFLLSFTILFASMLVFIKIAAALQAGNFFSETFIGKNFEKVNASSILILLGMGFGWAILHYFVFVSSNSLAVSVMHDIRRDIFEKLMDMPITYYKKNRTGEIISRVVNDIGVIEIFFMNIAVEFIVQPLTLILIICLMIVINPKISFYFLLSAPILGIILGLIGSLVQKLSLNVQKNISNITSSIQETIYGIEVIKGFGVEDAIKGKFLTTNSNYLKATKKELKARFLGTPTAEFLGVIGIVTILVLGAISVQKGIGSSGEIVSFILLALVLSEPLSRANEVTMVPRKLIPAAQRVFEIIDSHDKENFSRPDVGIIEGKLEFQHVSFEYESGLATLKNINLSIEKGETIAVIGPSGAGKSSLISLIPNFYYPSKGKLLIDGKDSKSYSPLSIRKQISIVTQETILFSGTILENIKLSRPDASEKEVETASKIAHAHEFISNFADGYHTLLGDRGTRLSGGEKQRIALARAILRKPKILILDEATSSLDAHSEQMIQKATTQILGKQTTFIVTHKLSAIAHADKIVLIEGGKIVEEGTHLELVKQNGLYQKLLQI
jgi:subfamily B ATP-binding cassette protein MsbA